MRIHGDEPTELFNNGFDFSGDPDTRGNGEAWDYADGFATRTGAGEGVFDQANYSSNAFVLNALTEQQHIKVFFAAGFTAVPEPSAALLCGLAGLRLSRRRR